MTLRLIELGAQLLFKWSDGAVKITSESVEFYDEEDQLSFSLSHDNFDDVIAGYQAFVGTPE